MPVTELNQRVDVFSHSTIGGMFPEARYTRVVSGSADGAWWAAVEPATTGERNVAAQIQSDVSYRFTFRKDAPTLTSDGAIRWPAGVGNPIYKIIGEPRLTEAISPNPPRVEVNATRAGDDVIANLVES